jgi:hypothetical protein
VHQDLDTTAFLKKPIEFRGAHPSEAVILNREPDEASSGLTSRFSRGELWSKY